MVFRFTRARALNDTAEIVPNRRFNNCIYAGKIGNGTAAFTRRANAIARNAPATNPAWNTTDGNVIG